MRNIVIILTLVLVVGGCGGGLYYLYSKNQEKDRVYQTEQPFVTDIIKKAVATGSVVPRKEIDIKPQVSGLIDKLYIEAGDRVNKGELIASIQIVPDMANLNNAENRVNLAEISLNYAKIDYDRNKPLYEEGVISKANFQQFQLALKNAEEELQAAKDNLEIIRKGSTAKYAQSGTDKVRATATGMILDVPVEEGNSVIEANTFNEGTTIASVANMDDMIFEGTVDESEVGKLDLGMNLLLTIGAIEDETFDAVLEYIAPKGVEENGAIQFEIRARVNLQSEQFIRAGYSANADIVLARKDSVLSIPESLLVFEGDSTFVEVERGTQNFEKKYIKTGISDGIHIEVIEGLTLEDKIKNPNQFEIE